MWIERVPLTKANGVNVQKAFEGCAVFRWGAPEVFGLLTTLRYIVQLVRPQRFSISEESRG